MSRAERAPTADLLGSLSPVEAKNAPETIEYRGDPSLLVKGVRVAVVGTRKPSELGVMRTERLVRYLAENAFTVVSGLAAGVDTVAHRRCMDFHGRTVAVLGSPLDHPYPKENAGLLEEIARSHLAISEFPSGSPILPTNFPRRNRTMALLSHATVIVEAGASSGTEHQGWEALRLGRELFLLESLLKGPASWPHEMIEYGAVILASPEQIVERLPSPAHVSEAESPF